VSIADFTESGLNRQVRKRMTLFRSAQMNFMNSVVNLKDGGCSIPLALISWSAYRSASNDMCI